MENYGIDSNDLLACDCAGNGESKVKLHACASCSEA